MWQEVFFYTFLWIICGYVVFVPRFKWIIHWSKSFETNDLYLSPNELYLCSNQLYKLFEPRYKLFEPRYKLFEPRYTSFEPIGPIIWT